MRIVPDLDQNSPAWLAYRKGGIGASDAPALMRQSPYGTPFSLWAEKTGLLKREEPNIYALNAMERGKRLEPEARAKAEAILGASFPAINVIHDEHDFIKASLDGWSNKLVKFMEIKCASKVEHAKTLKESKKQAGQGKVTDKYVPQVQQQSLITGVGGYFVSYYPDFVKGDSSQDLAIVEISPDKDFQAKLYTELVQFWGFVQSKTPPPVEASDLERVTKQIVGLQEKLSGASEALRLLTDALVEQAA